MARAVYGMDPESLALAGPEALADAFRAGAEGLALGDRLAHSALQRELLRRQDQRVAEDRKLEATLAAAAHPGVAGSPRAGSSARAGSSSPARAAAGSYTFADYIADLEAQRRLGETLAPLNTTLAELDALRAGAAPVRSLERRRQAVVETGTPGVEITAPRSLAALKAKGGVASFDQAGQAGLAVGGGTAPQLLLEPRGQLGPDAVAPNPLEKINYRPGLWVSPVDAARAIRRRGADYGLSREAQEALIQEYESAYSERAGGYRAKVRGLEAQERKSAVALSESVTRGLSLALSGQPPKTPMDKQDLANALQYEPTAFKVPTGERSAERVAQIKAAAPLLKAKLEQRKYNELEERLKDAREFYATKAGAETRAAAAANLPFADTLEGQFVEWAYAPGLDAAEAAAYQEVLAEIVDLDSLKTFVEEEREVPFSEDEFRALIHIQDQNKGRDPRSDADVDTLINLLREFPAAKKAFITDVGRGSGSGLGLGLVHDRELPPDGNPQHTPSGGATPAAAPAEGPPMTYDWGSD